jgi:hypothetical protein
LGKQEILGRFAPRDDGQARLRARTRRLGEAGRFVACPTDRALRQARDAGLFYGRPGSIRVRGARAAIARTAFRRVAFAVGTVWAVVVFLEGQYRVYRQAA